jgi:lysophospholipase L1-like esterase
MLAKVCNPPGKTTKFSKTVITGLVAVYASLLVGCAGGSDNAHQIPPETGNSLVPLVSAGTWVVMGSSTAAGGGATAGNRWTDLLQNSLTSRGAIFANIAKGGTVTYHGLSIISAAVANRPAPDPAANIDQALSRDPVVLLVSYPTNDIANGYTVEEAVNNVLTIRKAALDKKIPVLVLSTQPRNLTTAQLAQLQQIDMQLANSVGTCFVNVHGLLAGPDDKLAPIYNSGDGIHPNDAGHRVIADAVLKAINSTTCIRTQN